jgi:hypothetical protein
MLLWGAGKKMFSYEKKISYTYFLLSINCFLFVWQEKHRVIEA